MSIDQMLFLVGVVLALVGIWNMTGMASSQSLRDAATRDFLGLGVFGATYRLSGVMGIAKSYGLAILGACFCFAPYVVQAFGM